MTKRAKHKLVLVAWLALFFIMGSAVWSFQGGELMLLLFLIVSVVAYVVFAFAARCKQCRMPLLLRPVKVLGMDLFVWSLLTPEKCRHCGEAIL